MYLRRCVALLVSVVTLLAAVGSPALAQQGGSGLIISPTRTELTLEKGSQGVVKLSLKNVSGADIVAKAEVNDFTSDGVTGAPKILPNDGKKNPGSIKEFLQNVNDIPLKKDEKKDFEITVNVPANAAAGAYYGIVRYSAVGQNTDNNGSNNKVALTASLGSLILLTVPGNVTEQIQVNTIQVGHDNKFGNFFISPPNKSRIEVRNNGNGFAKPFGKVSITRGGKEVYSYELNNTDPKANILPSSARAFTDDIKNIKTPGRYTEIANLSYGNGGEVITAKTSFWYIPVWLLVVTGVLLAALIILALVVYRRKIGRGRAARSRR